MNNMEENIEPMQNKNRIFIYLLVFFFAVFIGTGLFLLLTSKSKTTGEKISTVKINENKNEDVDFPVEEPNQVDDASFTNRQENLVMPSVAPSNGSLTLETDLPGNQMNIGDMVELKLVADSADKNIVGYDVVMYYDSLAFDFDRALSSLPDYNIFTYKKGHFFTITGLKNLQSAPSPMVKATVATFTFTATKAGKFEFSLRASNDKDKTDLITDNTEVLVPALNQVMVDVK